MRTGSEMDEETRHGEAEVGDIEFGSYQQSTTAIDEIEPGYDETEDADLIRSQRDQVGVETETEDSDEASDGAQTGSRRSQEENSKKLDPDEIEKRKMHLKLYLAALEGKWNIAERIYENNGKEIIDHKITKRGETALHIAVSAGQTDFVGKLIQGMSKEAIRAENNLGGTAFSYAATSGKVELAHAMLKKDEEDDEYDHLANIRGTKNMLPIYMAALLGDEKMVSYLYDKTSDEILTDYDRIDLLVTLIDNDIYDVALTMVEKHKDFLATAQNGNNETALDALARKNFAHQALSGTRTKLFNLLCCGAGQKSNPLPGEAYRLLQLLWQEVLLYDDSTVSKVIGPPKLIFKAAERGNLGFLTTLIRSDPDLVFEVDWNNYSIFHIAVLHRHDDVFKLIHELGSSKCLISAMKDLENNNLLHLAAKLSPKNKLDAIPGAALQLQYELLWFEEVKKVVKKSCVEAKNKDSQTPGEIFLKEHKDLIEKGAQWMRDTANSCMLVATLIATVVFAAAFTLPGGNNQEDGNPMFLQKAQFQVFAIADAISLIFSVSAVLTFLSILTSRHALNDFLHSLPNKLVLGVGMLFISVVAMMVAYMAVIFIIFKNELLRIAIPIAVISVFPVVLFIWHQSGLLRDVVRSTYMSKSLFQPNKPTLFCGGASGKATKNKKGV